MRYILLLLILVACKTQKKPVTPEIMAEKILLAFPDTSGPGTWIQNDFQTLPGKDPYWPEMTLDRSGSYLETSALVSGFSGDSIEISVDGVIQKYHVPKRNSGALYGDNLVRRGHVEVAPEDTLISVGGGYEGYGVPSKKLWDSILASSGRDIYLESQGFEPGMIFYIRPVDSPSFKWKSMTFSSDSLHTPNKVCTRTDSIFIRH